MGTMNISLPEALRAYVEKRVAEGTYGTTSEFLRELIRKDQARHELRQKLMEGLESPVIGEVDEGYWASKRKALRRKP